MHVMSTSATTQRDHVLRLARASGRSLFLAALVVACSPSDPPADVSARARHLILVTIDTLRADHLSLYGYRRDTSSAAGATVRGSVAGFTIDELARQGVVFERALAPRGETFPSISTLFTGRTPLENCTLANEETLPKQAFTLAERLRAAGYRSAAFTTNKLLVPRSGIEQGFDSFFVDSSDDREVRATAAAMQWISTQDLAHGPPLFVWLHLMGPHLPYDPRPIDGIAFAKMFVDPKYEGVAEGSRAFLDPAYTEGRELGAADVDHIVALYDGEIARIDHVVSRFASFCAGKDPRQPVDLLSDALFVFTADHGEELHQRNRYWGHSKSVYDSVLHVPLFMRHPASLPSGRSIGAVVELEDVLPTVLERLGLACEGPVHGRSLGPYLRTEIDTQPLPPKSAFSSWHDRIFTVRTDRWRLVWNPERVEPKEIPVGPYPIPEVALHDLTADPRELVDVSATHGDVVAELKRSIESWRAGQTRCQRGSETPSAERLQALKDLGYAGDDDKR
jgi:arylsulfatase A-like enzyme